MNIGIIGCGKIAELRHVPEYQENPHTTIVAFQDAFADRAAAWAEKYGARTFPTIDALLADPSIDAVSICAANGFHASLSIAALEAGKHVLCEKPMATSLEDCEAMTAAAERTGRLLMIGHNQRYAESNRIARELIEKDEIGEILSFHTSFAHQGPEQWTGQSNPWFFDRNIARFGAVADLGIHKIDVIHYLTGQHTTEVTARVETLHKTFPDGTPVTVDDNAFCILRLSGGAVGTMRASWTHYGREENFTRLYGTKGVLRIDDDPTYALILEKKTGEVFRYELNGVGTNAQQLAGQRTNTGVIDAFVDAIRSGNPPLAEGKEAVKAMRAVFGALQSSEAGKTITV